MTTESAPALVSLSTKYQATRLQHVLRTTERATSAIPTAARIAHRSGSGSTASITATGGTRKSFATTRMRKKMKENFLRKVV